MYDPKAHARELGLTVETFPVRTGNALTIPEQKLILIRPRLRVVHYRSVLAHEIVHFEHLDFGCSGFQEARADRIAASRLIQPDDLVRAARMYDHEVLIARELNVTTKILRAWKEAA